METEFAPAMNSLESKLSTMPIGSTVSYAYIQEICGLDVRVHRHVLESVKKRLMRYHKMELVNLRGKGYRIGLLSSNADDIIDCTKLSDELKLKVIGEHIEGASFVEVSKESGVVRIMLQ